MANALNMKHKNINKTLIPLYFIGPHLLIFLIFFLVPAIFGLYISFTNWDLINTPEFVGLDNYIEILKNSDSTFYTQFYNGLENTFKFAIYTVPLCIIIPLLFALALHTKPIGTKFFQSLFYLPTLFSISAVMIIWAVLFNPAFGPINTFLNLDANWKGEQPYAWIALVIITIWWTIGGNMIIFQAAINGVPKDYYEAAALDGASKVRQFFSITLPSIKNPLLFTVVMTTIAQLNIYGQPLMLTGGGPDSSTTVLLMYIKQNAFGTGQSIAGISSAMAVMLGLCIMLVSIVQFYLLRNRD